MRADPPLEDLRLTGLEPLPAPSAVKAARPASPEAAATVGAARAALRRALHEPPEDRLVVIAGPCSLHDAEAALEYAERLLPLARAHAGELVVLMRTYFEKPRTTVGWKGLVNDPHLDGSCAVAEGLARARDLLARINALGLPCATEFLDPVTPQYLADLVAWAAIGARTTESQTHREMASGLSMPVGFKNGTDGDVQGALDAMVAASHPHSFLGIRPDGCAAVVKTAGNPDTHLVLRGGRSGPNHGPAELLRAAAATAERGACRGVLVDCSHANSGRDPRRQAGVCRQVLGHLAAGGAGLLGVMIESHLHEGRQAWSPGATLRYGVSITDGCIGFGETQALLGEIAGAVRRRRALGAGRAAGMRSAVA